MNTECTIEETAVSSAKSRTLKTLLQVICAEDEFAILRETLRLYSEEIALVEGQ